MLLGIARIHDMLNDPDKAIGFYKKVLILDASNVESIACLGAHYFYADQVWIVLCNTSSSLQYTISLTCFNFVKIIVLFNL